MKFILVLQQNVHITMLTRSNTNESTRFYTLPLQGRLMKYLRFLNVPWVGAGSLYNFSQNKTLADWLALDNKEHANLFDLMLQKQGRKFKAMVLKDMALRLDIEIPTVSYTVNEETANRTLTLMQQGIPVIHRAPLHDPTKKLWCVSDLLVRSDYLKKWFGVEYPYSDTGASKLFGPYHYCAVDITFKTLSLLKDQRTLSLSEEYLAIRAQLMIATDILGAMQGYVPSIALVLGRQYRFLENSKSITMRCYYDRTALVHCSTELRDLVTEGLQWRRKCSSSKASNWSAVPLPSCKELYPNLKKPSSAQECAIASDLDDVTQIWNCGPKQRDLLFAEGITSFMDERCNAKTMGFKGNRARIIDAILETQRQQDNVMLPTSIRTNSIYIPGTRDYFVDFEIMPEALIDDLCSPTCERNPFLFLIGVGWVKNDIWQYRSFHMNDLNLEEERRNLLAFIDFVPSLRNVRLFHWSTAEPRMWEDALKRHNIVSPPLTWTDLSLPFTLIPITLKGCMNFTLKSIAKAMYDHQLITTKWSVDIPNGLDCAANAMSCYNTGSSLLPSIFEYNKTDCRVMYEILFALHLHYNSQ